MLRQRRGCIQSRGKGNSDGILLAACDGIAATNAVNATNANAVILAILAVLAVLEHARERETCDAFTWRSHRLEADKYISVNR